MFKETHSKLHSWRLADRVSYLALPTSQKDVLRELARHYPHVHPSIDRLSFFTGYSRRNIQYALKKLCERGLVIRHFTTGRRMTDYELVVDQILILAAGREQDLKVMTAQHFRQKGTGRGVQHLHCKGRNSCTSKGCNICTQTDKVEVLEEQNIEEENIQQEEETGQMKIEEIAWEIEEDQAIDRSSMRAKEEYGQAEDNSARDIHLLPAQVLDSKAAVITNRDGIISHQDPTPLAARLLAAPLQTKDLASSPTVVPAPQRPRRYKVVSDWQHPGDWLIANTWRECFVSDPTSRKKLVFQSEAAAQARADELEKAA